MVARMVSGTSTTSVVPPEPRVQLTATVPRWVHIEPLAEPRPARGGAIWMVAAPGPVTLTPRNVSSTSTAPHEPQPCEKLARLVWSTIAPEHGAVAQPGSQ